MLMDLEAGLEESVPNIDVIFALSIADALQMTSFENNAVNSPHLFDLAIIEISDLNKTSRGELASLFRFCKAAILTMAGQNVPAHDEMAKAKRVFVKPYRLSDIIACAVDALSEIKY